MDHEDGDGEVQEERKTDQSNQRSANSVLAQQPAQQLQLSMGLKRSRQRAQTQTQLQTAQLMDGHNQPRQNASNERIRVDVRA